MLFLNWLLRRKVRRLAEVTKKTEQEALSKALDDALASVDEAAFYAAAAQQLERVRASLHPGPIRPRLP